MSIDVFGGINLVRNGKNRRSAKVVVEFKAPSLVFAPQHKAIAKTLADAMAAKFRDLMLSGQWLDGRPLPNVAPKTAIRRRFRLLQIERGPAALVLARKAVHKDTRERKRIDRRYKTEKLGTTYPSHALSDRNLVGLESGTMAQFTVAARGEGMQVFAPNVRGKIDRSGSSAWLRVLKKMGGFKRMDGILSTPTMIVARLSAWWSCFKLDGTRMVSSKDFRRGVRSLKRIGDELAETAQRFGDIAQEAEQIAEPDDA